MNQHHLEHLKEVIKIQNSIKDIHPLLEKLMAVAIVEGDYFLIYDCVPGEESYMFIKQAPTPMPVPAGVRAAFPLECYGGKAACVVTGEVFDSLDGYVTIFHEFVHCQQYETCENRLKMTLQIARQAQVRNDFMWELNHPFPYHQSRFVDAYTALFHELERGDPERARDCRKGLKDCLEHVDFEYMVWQEWKEGFARFIENSIRRRLGLDENHNGRDLPYSRVSFYESGSKFIETLERQNVKIPLDIESLFFTMIEE